MPFTIARPSLGPSFTDLIPASLSAISALAMRRWPADLSPVHVVKVGFPCITPPMKDNGLKSPDADMLPRIGILGTISWLRSSARQSVVATCTPDTPVEREFSRIDIDARIQDSGMQVAARGSSSGRELASVRNTSESPLTGGL